MTHVLVKPGDSVAKGAALIILEAMKMEITLVAPHDAVIETVRFGVGDMVDEGAELIGFVT